METYTVSEKRLYYNFCNPGRRTKTRNPIIQNCHTEGHILNLRGELTLYLCLITHYIMKNVWGVFNLEDSWSSVVSFTLQLLYRGTPSPSYLLDRESSGPLRLQIKALNTKANNQTCKNLFPVSRLLEDCRYMNRGVKPGANN
jgi:hypothetical protein